MTKPKTPAEWKQHIASLPKPPPPRVPTPEEVRAEEEDARFMDAMVKLARRGIIGRWW